LYKWVNYMYGWKRRYFVLHTGVLRYCAERGSHAKGAVHLNLAQVIPHPSKPMRFKIDTGVTVIHLKAASPDEASQWIEALTKSKNELSEEQNFREHRPSEAESRHSTERSTLIKKVSDLSVFEAELEELIEDKRLPSDSETKALLHVARNLRQQAANLLSMFEEEDKSTTKIQHELERASLSPSPKKSSPFKYYAENDTESLIFHDAMSHAESLEDFLDPTPEKLTRRSLPVLRNPRYKAEVWHGLKDCESLDLWGLEVPLNLYEPLSGLQRLAEDLTYSSLLVDASRQTEVAKMIAYVALFALSAYSFSDKRIYRPFPPINGETYEFERDGFKAVAEQVSTNISALSSTHNDFEYSGSFEPVVGCRQGVITIEPIGNWKVKIGESTFTWTKPKTVITGLGSKDIKVRNVGKITITDSKSSYTAHIDFESGASRDTVTGSVMGPAITTIYNIKESQNRGFQALSPQGEVVAAFTPLHFAEGHEYNYYFSDFTLQLNHMPELVADLPPTDSRKRPDIRALENGDLTRTEAERKRLVLKSREASNQPRWFKKLNSEWTLENYWEAKVSGEFSRLPVLFVS